MWTTRFSLDVAMFFTGLILFWFAALQQYRRSFLDPATCARARPSSELVSGYGHWQQPAHAILEAQPQTERDEAHEVLRHRRDPPEVRAGRIRVRVLPVLPVEQVVDVDAHLDGPVVADADRARQTHVEEAQPLAADAVDAEAHFSTGSSYILQKNRMIVDGVV
jgi:hypothetical protein